MEGRIADSDLYDRGCGTLVASWEEIARGSDGAALHRIDGVAAAVFPSEPERSFYNNALVDRRLAATERATAIAAMESVYSTAGIDRFAAWVHESDEDMQSDLTDRGYTVEESSRAMGMSLEDVRLPPPGTEVAPSTWSDYVEYLEAAGAPGGLLKRVDPRAFHLAMIRLADGPASAAISFEHSGDCGVFNVFTIEAARRRGFGSTVTALLLGDAVARGCTTSSLQSTPLAERVYRALGFRDLGSILEHVPAEPARAIAR